MLTRARGVLGSLVLLVAQLAVTTPVAATTGPYTLPYFDPSNYKTQGCHQGCAYDYSLDYEPVAASRQGTVVEAVSGWGPGGCSPSYGSKANYIVLRHSDNQLTFYLHLSALNVGLGALVSAGQKIGTSGQSGYACGPHLHYALYQDVRDTAHSLVPDGRWTTDPGRVPWLAGYVTEASPAGYSVMQYSRWTTWVQVRNNGGRTWSQTNDSYGRGRVWLGSVTSSGGSSRISSFYVSGNWLSNTNTGLADANNVAPGQTVRFTFDLYAAPSGGSFTEYFNLGAESLAYFPYSYFGYYYIPISVTHCC